eukprot:jgi/Botrbrau1/3570/Bobra.0078s0027.1
MVSWKAGLPVENGSMRGLPLLRLRCGIVIPGRSLKQQRTIAAQASSNNGAAALEQESSGLDHHTPTTPALIPPLRVQNGRPVLQVPTNLIKPTQDAQASVNGAAAVEGRPILHAPVWGSFSHVATGAPSTIPQLRARAPGLGPNRLRIFSGTSNEPLAQEVACCLGVELSGVKIKRFADGEIYEQIKESIRGCDVFLIQPTCPPVNDHLMELLIMIDACKRASARSITAVIPYFGYARADRINQGREAITAKLVANLITEAGANRVLAIDPAQRAVRRVLRHPRGPRVRGFCDSGLPGLQEDILGGPGGGLPGRRGRRTGPRLCQEAERRAPGHRG